MMNMNIPFPEILEPVAKSFGITIEQLLSRSRKRSICDARQISIYLIHSRGILSHGAIAALFGLERTTVLHACQSVEMMAATSPGYARKLSELRDKK